MKPLSDNPQHIRELSARLSLGQPCSAVKNVRGGFHHKVWRLQTERGYFAIKQLAADTDINNAAVIDHFNAAEAVAEAFYLHGVAAVCALKYDRHYVHILDQSAYLVYPWCNGKALSSDEVSHQHAIKVATILAQMHGADIEVPDIPVLQFDLISRAQLIAALDNAVALKGPYAADLASRLDEFLQLHRLQHDAVHVLQKNLVISHGDLDQKNLLWNANDEPLLIDWESARRLNPTREILLAALDWSGISSDFNADIFQQMLTAYKQAGGIIDNAALQASFDFILGDWLSWLIYNVACSVDSHMPERQLLAAEQISFVLQTMRRLQRLRPELLAMAGLALR